MDNEAIFSADDFKCEAYDKISKMILNNQEKFSDSPFMQKIIGIIECTNNLVEITITSNMGAKIYEER